MVKSVCKQCDKEFERDRRQKFCSRSCAACYNNRVRKDRGWTPSIEHRQKTANALRGRKGHSNHAGIKRSMRIEVPCPECSKMFVKTTKSPQKYCNRVCAVKNMGGYREGSGRSKSGYYKGIFCASTYELAWVVDRIDNDLLAKRFDGFIVYNSDRKYYPDFIDGNMIYEIKGWVTDDTELVIKDKCDAAIREGYDITVLYKDEMKLIIKKVKDIHGVVDIEELYDDFKPSITYECRMCGDEFHTNQKRPRKLIEKGHVFCSKKCSRMYVVTNKNAHIV